MLNLTEIRGYTQPVHLIHQGHISCASPLHWCFTFFFFFTKQPPHPASWQSIYWHAVRTTFPSLFWSPSHLIFSLAPHPPLMLFAAVDIHLPSVRRVLEKSSSRRSNGRKSRCFLSMFPWLVTLKEISPLAALAETPHFPKTTGAQFDCIQFCDNKAGCLNESQTRFSYVRQGEELLPCLTSSLPSPAGSIFSQYSAFQFLKSLSLLSQSLPHR